MRMSEEIYSECMGAPAYRDEFIVTLSHVSGYAQAEAKGV